MARKKSKYDATPSLLGFLYQTRFALLLGLRRNDPNAIVSIEKIDDVAFHKDIGSGSYLPNDLRQMKHHLTKKGGLGDKSLDVWKTLRVWIDAIQTNLIDLDNTEFFLVTTSKATKRHAVRFLLSEPTIRDAEKARKELESSGATSSDKDVTTTHAALMKLSKKRRQKFFGAIHLIDDSQDVQQLRQQIENEVRLATASKHRVTFTDLLEGWWFRVVVDHLMEPNGVGIFVRQIEEQVGELREQFKRENLPDELFDAPVPDSKRPNDDPRQFVKQLSLIDVSDKRVRSAQEDHFKAFEQRSKWIRKALLGIEELQKLESRLTDEWLRRFNIMLEGTKAKDEDEELVQSGKALYQWIELDAPNNPLLFVRPEFRSPYMTRGSYHMLSDQLRIGWHPNYESMLNNQTGDDGDAG